MAVSSFWSQQCPERGAGLDHAHWRDCDPEKGHPPDPTFPFEGTVVHQWAQCCHCEHTVESWEQERDAELRAAGIAPSIDDHEYQPTIVGLCNRCKKPFAEHAPAVKVVSFTSNGCTHTNLNKTPLIGEAGLEWPECPNCGQQKEPKLATGTFLGPAWERGRVGNGWVNPRTERAWGEIAYRHREYLAALNAGSYVP